MTNVVIQKQVADKRISPLHQGAEAAKGLDKPKQASTSRSEAQQEIGLAKSIRVEIDRVFSNPANKSFIAEFKTDSDKSTLHIIAAKLPNGAILRLQRDVDANGKIISRSLYRERPVLASEQTFATDKVSAHRDGSVRGTSKHLPPLFRSLMNDFKNAPRDSLTHPKDYCTRSIQVGWGTEPVTERIPCKNYFTK
jgi:hypothetical protein